MAEKKTFWQTLTGAITGLALFVGALATIVFEGERIYEFVTDKLNWKFADPKNPTVPPGDSTSPLVPLVQKCTSPWNWNEESQRCTNTVSIAGRTFTIHLDRKITQVRGRIDFYINRERLPGTDANGQAMYNTSRGTVQVVISIMLDKTLVGEQRKVIYSTSNGGICSVSPLPEPIDYFKKMRVAHSLELVNCAPQGAVCRTRLVKPGKKVHIETLPLRATISPKC